MAFGTGDPPLSCCGINIPVKKQLRLLGYGLDPLLNGLFHLDLMKRNVLPRIRSLKLLAQTRWGCDTETLKQFYTAFVRPAIEYSHPLLIISNKSVAEKVEVYQNSCLRIITGTSAHARNANLRKMLELPTIMDRCAYLSATLYENCSRKTGANPERSAAETVVNRIGSRDRKNWNATVINIAYPDGFRMNRLPLQFFNALSPPQMDQIKSEFPICVTGPADKCDYELFTDGSFCLTSLSGGGGVVLLLNGREIHKESIPLGRIHSSFEAELLTLFRIFEFLDDRIEHLDGAKRISVSTDSQSSLSFLNSSDTPQSPYLFKNYWRCAFDFHARTGIRLQYGFVRGHSGIVGNEMADKEANDGRLVAERGEMADNDVSFESSKSILKKRLLSGSYGETSDHLEEALGGEGYKKRKLAIGLLERNDEVTILQLISGKCSITADHLHRIGVSPAPTCPGCWEVDDSISHLLLNCPAYHSNRMFAFGDNITLNILSKSPKSVCDFLKKINRFTSKDTMAKITARAEQRL